MLDRAYFNFSESNGSYHTVTKAGFTTCKLKRCMEGNTQIKLHVYSTPVWLKT
jgi:hypothetical protein